MNLLTSPKSSQLDRAKLAPYWLIRWTSNSVRSIKFVGGKTCIRFWEVCFSSYGFQSVTVRGHLVKMEGTLYKVNWSCSWLKFHYTLHLPALRCTMNFRWNCLYFYAYSALSYVEISPKRWAHQVIVFSVSKSIANNRTFADVCYSIERLFGTRKPAGTGPDLTWQEAFCQPTSNILPLNLRHCGMNPFWNGAFYTREKIPEKFESPWWLIPECSSTIAHRNHYYNIYHLENAKSSCAKEV